MDTFSVGNIVPEKGPGALWGWEVRIFVGNLAECRNALISGHSNQRVGDSKALNRNTSINAPIFFRSLIGLIILPLMRF